MYDVSEKERVTQDSNDTVIKICDILTVIGLLLLL